MKKALFIFLFCILSSMTAVGIELNYNGHNLEYNPDELKFYENGKILSASQLQNIFPDFEIVLISNFKDRKYKVKKSFFKPKNILLLNDTERTFHRFYIYPEASRYEKNPEIKSLIRLYGKKNVHLKHAGGDKFDIIL